MRVRLQRGDDLLALVVDEDQRRPLTELALEADQAVILVALPSRLAAVEVVVGVEGDLSRGGRRSGHRRRPSTIDAIVTLSVMRAPSLRSRWVAPQAGRAGG